jgi:hypothetical protein
MWNERPGATPRPVEVAITNLPDEPLGHHPSDGRRAAELLHEAVARCWKSAITQVEVRPLAVQLTTSGGPGGSTV